MNLPDPPELLRHLVNVDTEATPIEGAEVALVRNPDADPGDADEWVAGTVASSGASGFVVEAGHVDGGAVLWRWGVNVSGQPYFDSAGAEAGEEQVLMVDDGLFYVEGAPL